eukprot:CAMPEP_0168306286 /NCGR_PEP_ID=MMETSP0142_2-20121227/53455_1 /TAXON_ID=44445 /ORGANISM="Pseudo-nitzschia australis, Strain 10249 10 AB" /LENGTH=672 /DNA_ID=CAMNT_0008258019 /DNA_START=64 /DNA_END=2082 /DNA_ORIENTATION=+
MTQFSCYDELEMDGRPRVCGGAIFVKFMQKGKCRSPPSKNSKKNQNSFLTSSSSSSSFALDEAELKVLYDPTNPQYCMPRQIEGTTATSPKEPRNSSKLDFRLQPLENAISFHDNNVDFQTNFFSLRDAPEEYFCAEDSALSQSIVQFDPRLINDMKTIHLRSIDGRKSLDNMSQSKQSVEPSSITSSPNGVDTIWNDLQYTRIDQLQGQCQSKVHVMRKEMTSFRKEIDAFKKSLPTQLQSKPNPCSAEDDVWKKTNMFAPKEHIQDVFPHYHQIDSNGSSDQDVWQKIDQFALKRQTQGTVDCSQFNPSASSDQDDVWKENSAHASREQTQVDTIDNSKKYFKSEWNFNFRDHEKQNDERTEPSHPDDEKSSENEKQTLEQSDGTLRSVTNTNENLVFKPSENSVTKSNESSVTKPSENFVTKIYESLETKPNENSVTKANESSVKIINEKLPVTDEIPFDEDLDIPKVEQDSQGCSNHRKSVTSLSSRLIELERTELERLESIHSILQREISKATNRKSVDDSNYDEDFEIVQKLLKKYTEKETSEKPRVGKPTHVHPALEAPTDSWFHRHAVGSTRMQRKLDKITIPIVDDKKESNPPQQIDSETRDSSLHEKPTLGHGVAPISSKKVNRVRFAIDDSQPVKTNTTKGSIHSIGKLSEKIKFWETSTP